MYILLYGVVCSTVYNRFSFFLLSLTVMRLIIQILKENRSKNIKLAKQYKNHANCTMTGIINILVLNDH